MSISYSTIKIIYKHLSYEVERGQIQAYLSEGKTPAEIARLLNQHRRSTISRELKQGCVTQKQDKNGKEIYYQAYFAETTQLLYRKRRENSVFLLLPRMLQAFLEALSQAIKAKPRYGSFVHWYRAQHPHMIIPSTKTLLHLRPPRFAWPQVHRFASCRVLETSSQVTSVN